MTPVWQEKLKETLTVHWDKKSRSWQIISFFDIYIQFTGQRPSAGRINNNYRTCSPKYCNSGSGQKTQTIQIMTKKNRQPCSFYGELSVIFTDNTHTKQPCVNSRHWRSPWTLTWIIQTYIQSHSAKIHTLCSQCILFFFFLTPFYYQNDTEHKHTYTI